MKYLSHSNLGVPKKKKYIKSIQALDEFLQIFKMAYGGVKIGWYKSEIPQTILGSVKNSVKVSREKANHVIVRWADKRLMELFYGPSKFSEFKLRGFFYNKTIDAINYEEAKKVTKILKRYGFKVYEIPLLEYGPIPWIIAAVMILLLIIQFVRSII
ncbi:MAG: hypothetical protein L6408_01200 [Nanoarchaeota archaeon]|nr:hypothetical protein [Nanoarchaeota archaeon]